MDLFGSPTMLVEKMGLTALVSSAQPSMLAILIVGQLVGRLIKGAIEVVRKGK